MSWDDRIQNIKFSITTGDGKTFYPLWKNSEKSKEYNVGTFDFINVSGSLVERKKPKAAKIPLTFYFDGIDCIEKAEDFERSADDNRVWKVVHPYYGTINGQPLSISRKDDNLNISEISVDFWESIDVDYPNSNFNVKDNSFDKKDKCLESLVFSADKPVYKTADIQKLRDQNLDNSTSFYPVVNASPNIADEYFAVYQNKISKATKSSDDLLNTTFDAIRQAQDLVSLPSRIETSIKVRVEAYKLAFEKSKQVLNSISDKYFFQSNAGSIIANLADSLTTPIEGDYILVSEIYAVSEVLSSMYDEYLEILDSASVSIYDIEDSWSPDSTSSILLHDLVTYVLGSLFVLGLDSFQERIVTLEKDSNLILLTHKYLGLDASDENIENFRKINDIKLNELFKLKKGREIKYYV